jgi:pantetheine-phosphate adenylyltransferase
MERITIYPGLFDPPTNGHIDMVERGLELFDKIIIAILIDPSKESLFTAEERKEMFEDIFKNNPNVEIDFFEGLLVDYVAMKKAHSVMRGLRAVSDFESEFQLAMMNRKLNKEIQTVFLMTGLRWIYIGSSIVKEAASFGADVSSMVPDIVNKMLVEKFSPGS